MRPSSPALAVTAGLVALEAVAVLVIGVLTGLSGDAGRLVMDVTATLFFVLYGVGLGWCAWGLWRRNVRARGPALFAQLIQLGVAWSFASGSTRALAIVPAAVAIVVIVLLLAPATTRELVPDGPDEPQDGA